MNRLNDDIRPLAQRLCDDTRDALRRYANSRCVQAAAAGTLDRASYARWLAAQRPVHAALDRQIIAHCEDVPILAATVPDESLQCPWVDESLAALGSVEPTRLPDAEAAVDQINTAAEHEPLKLFAQHFVRESLLNVGRYLAPRLAHAWGDATPAELRFLDPHGRGQRPLWARFCRDVDKHRLTEHERQAIVSAANTFFASLTGIAAAAAEPRAPDQPRIVPVSL